MHRTLTAADALPRRRMIPRIVLLLTLGIVGVISSWGAGISETRLVGTWQATDERLTYTLVLRADRRATRDLAIDFGAAEAQSPRSRPIAGVWELEGNQLLFDWQAGEPSKSAILKLSGDTLTLGHYHGEQTLTFRRIKSAAETNASNEGMPDVLYPTDVRRK